MERAKDGRPRKALDEGSLIMIIPDFSRLRVTRHACNRANERLGIRPYDFIQWCQNTCHYWTWRPVQWMYAQGLDVAINGRSRRPDQFYHHPWAEGQHVCLVVAPREPALKTVMTFSFREVDPQLVCRG